MAYLVPQEDVLNIEEDLGRTQQFIESAREKIKAVCFADKVMAFGCDGRVDA